MCIMSPKICALIPAFNEAEVIAGTIEALRVAGFHSNDIFVVDDNSTDDTAAIATQAGSTVYTVPKNGGKARAQVAAIEHFNLTSRYDYVAFLDGDTKVDPQFLTVMRQAVIENPTTDLFVGQVASAKSNHVFSTLRAYEYALGNEIMKKGQDNFGVIFVSPGCASVYKTSTLSSLNIDDSTLAEDMDLTIQVHRRNGKVKYIADAVVITQDPSTFSCYHKQLMRWYRGFWQVMLKHKVFSFAKKQRVDVYMLYIATDILLFNRVLAFIVLGALFSLSTVGMVWLVDICIYALIALIVSIKTRRLDVLAKMPVYYWLSYVNLYGSLRSFIEIVVCRKKILTWNKVKRYQFDSVIVHH